MLKILLVTGAGSFAGGIIRYLVASALNPKYASFPAGTFAVNISGSFFIGVFIALLSKKLIADDWYYFIGVGLLGGFTTFSAFSAETAQLLRNGELTNAVIYMSASVITAVAGAITGMYSVNYYFKSGN